MMRTIIKKLKGKSHSFDGMIRPAFVKFDHTRHLCLIAMLLSSPKDPIREFEVLRKSSMGRSKILQAVYNYYSLL